MSNTAENKHSPTDPGTELFRLAESLLGPERVKKEIVSGEPAIDGDHFSLHLFVSPGWDDAQSRRTDAVRIQVIDEFNSDRVFAPWTEVSPDGSAITERYIHNNGHISSERKPTDEYEISKLLDAVQEGKVIDPDTEVVIDRTTETEPNLPPMRRVFKKKSIRRFGTSITDKVRNLILQ
jgi:hypothetical protein